MENQIVNRSVTSHRSTAYVRAIGERGTGAKSEAITPQFRFIVTHGLRLTPERLAYDVQCGKHGDSAMKATITARGSIPTPKPLPKAPRIRLLQAWKTAIWDAVYRLDAFHDRNLKSRRPGFVIAAYGRGYDRDSSNTNWRTWRVPHDVYFERR